MSIKYTNLTYNELRKLAPKDKPFQVVVQSNPYGEGGKQTLWATMPDIYLNTCLFQRIFNGVDYGFAGIWGSYKETFDLIIHHSDDTTLERFEVGDEVEILECARPFITKYDFLRGKMPIEKYIGKYTGNTNDLIIIKTTIENKNILYTVGDGEVFETLPHNCLRKVVSKKIELKTITIRDKTYLITEELTNALKNLKEVD